MEEPILSWSTTRDVVIPENDEDVPSRRVLWVVGLWPCAVYDLWSCDKARFYVA